MKLREALEKGWKRETHITGVGRGGIKGEVVYTSPCGRSFKHCSDIVKFLEKQSSDLGRENFSFSCRILLGDYIESVQGKEPIRHSEETLAIKLSEMMVQHRSETFSLHLLIFITFHILWCFAFLVKLENE
ncbi:hypothetical protein AAG570_010268 [Ranatra chinensis]|uniref:MBD domain-containing protein n=1 Tax=Ranatra chinensis TaxID=642074 RepID=A0ABD0YY52_9HEMI